MKQPEPSRKTESATRRSVQPVCSAHDWAETKITDSCGFGVVFGVERKCRKCGAHQVASYCEGRTGGPWRDVAANTKVSSGDEPR